MTSFVALLRGINVGGNKLIAMAELRQLVESLGFVEVQSLLQSGNVIFKSRSSGAMIEKLLEKETLRHFGHSVDFFVRDPKEWKAIVAGNPFHKEAANDPSHLLVMCLREAPKAKALAALKAAVTGREYFHAQGRYLYLVYPNPDGVGRSRLTGPVIEAKLGTRGTARNWNTVQKIAALLAEG